MIRLYRVCLITLAGCAAAWQLAPTDPRMTMVVILLAVGLVLGVFAD